MGINIGDFIKCHDKDEMIDLMSDLLDEGFEADFCYEKDGEKGYWLEVLDYSSETYKKAFKYCLESFATFSEEINYEHEDLTISIETTEDDAEKIGILKDLSICTGKLTMLYEVIRFMNGAMKEVLEAEDDQSNSTDGTDVP